MTATLFWNVDTQYDFVRDDGKLPVPGAEQIEDNLQTLTDYAEDRGIRVVNTADWHNAETEEIAEDPDYETTFPEHCMQGTDGAAYVPATEPDDPYVVDWQDDDVDRDAVQENREVVLYKDMFDVFEGSPHTDDVLDALDPDEVVVYGVATDVCVNYAVNGLLDRGYDVAFVEDATAGLAEDDALQGVMQGWEDRGATRITTDQVVDQYRPA